MRTLLSRLRALFHRRRLEEQLDDEVSAHLDLLAADYVRRGMAPDQARVAARRAFGGVEPMKERYRDGISLRWLDDAWRDLQLSLRALINAPVFAASAVLTLAIGMTATIGMFTIVNAVMLRPLPVQRPAELISISNRTGFPGDLSFRDLEDYRAERAVLADAVGYTPKLTALNAGDRAERLTIEIVTDNYFSMLGVGAAAGRVIQRGEGHARGDAPVVVLDYEYWRSRFAGDPSVIGRSVRLNGRPFTIIGVAAKAFTGTETLVDISAYVPVWMADDLLDAPGALSILEDRAARRLTMLGRLQPGVSLERARDALNLKAAALAREFPASNKGARLAVIPETHARPNPAIGPFLRRAALALIGLAVIVLLITSANVANLLMARAASRGREVAVRAALGAKRSRIVRQFLAEGIALAAMAVVVALPAVLLITHALHGVVAGLTSMATLEPDFSVDIRVMAATLAVALGAGIAASLRPALAACRNDSGNSLRSGGDGAIGSSGNAFRRTLVVLQVALSLALLISGGLFVRSLDRARDVDLGFDPHGLLLASAAPGMQGYDPARRPPLYQAIRDRVASLPDVEQAGWISLPPLGVITERATVSPESRPSDPDWSPPTVFSAEVSPEYFETLRIPFVDGRPFTDRDVAGARPVAIIDEALAVRFWPDSTAVGRRLVSNGETLDVVGVVRGGKYATVWEAAMGAVFLPIAQGRPPLATLVVRTARADAQIAPAVAEAMRAIDPALAVYDVRSMAQHLDNGSAFFVFRLGAFITSLFGGLGLVLASIGLYGMMAFHVGRRRREIALRMALGAGQANVLRTFVGDGAQLALAGIGVGIVLAVGLAMTLRTLLVGVSPFDPVTYGAVTASLLAVCVLASFVPARRATLIDPMIALRAD
jgi:predicted permease